MTDIFTILPTGTCFEDSTLLFGRMIAEDLEKDHSGKDLKLVHGICCFDGIKNPCSHAWVEFSTEVETYVVFAVILKGNRETKKEYFQTSLDEFYRDCCVRETQKYSLTEAILAEKVAGHAPPWEKIFIDLCKDKREKI